MKVYAIRHKPSGECMPARMLARMSARSRSGWSAWIPGPETPAGHWGGRGVLDQPRIFFTAQSARDALTMWLAGVWRNEWQSSVDWETCNDEGGSEFISVTPPVPRVREDMEIVELELTGL